MTKRMTRGGQKESNILRACMLTASRASATIYRNNVGVAVYPSGHRVAYGLCPGSSDLIGLVPVTITPEHVGQQMAVFLAVETKRASGRATREQMTFLEHVAQCGGVAVLADGCHIVAHVLEGAAEGKVVWGRVHRPMEQR